MTQSQIQYFLAVAQEMSFSRAAELLFVSQPAVSRQVAQLEQELGVPLFERTNQGISITEAGREFEKFFRDSTRSFQQLRERLRNGGEAVRGTVRIGCVEGWDLSEFYPKLLAALTERYPHLKLDLSGFNHDHIIQSLEHGDVDVVITADNLLYGHDRVSSARLTSRRGILLFSAQHPLAKKEGLTLSDFKDEPFYITAPATMRETTIELIALCTDSDFMPKIEHVPSLSAAYLQLSSGRGVMLCNDWMMACSNPLFATLPLQIQRGISLAWLTENDSPHVALFIKELLLWFQQKEK